jgi:hypothetical protein
MTDYTKPKSQDTPPVSIPTDSWWPRGDERCRHTITRQFKAEGRLPQIPDWRMHEQVYAEAELEPEVLHNGDTLRCNFTVSN